MPVFTWDNKYSVSVSEMDNQHKKLIDIINNLYDAMQQGQTGTALSRIIGDLLSYTRQHFSAEERIMQQHDYPKFAAQKKEHDFFIEKVKKYQDDLNSGKTSFSVDMSVFLKNWLVNHISVVDKEYGSFFNQKGIK